MALSAGALDPPQRDCDRRRPGPPHRSADRFWRQASGKARRQARSGEDVHPPGKLVAALDAGEGERFGARTTRSMEQRAGPERGARPAADVLPGLEIQARFGAGAGWRRSTRHRRRALGRRGRLQGRPVINGRTVYLQPGVGPGERQAARLRGTERSYGCGILRLHKHAGLPLGSRGVRGPAKPTRHAELWRHSAGLLDQRRAGRRIGSHARRHGSVHVQLSEQGVDRPGPLGRGRREPRARRRWRIEVH